MMAVRISFMIPVPFSEWVTSANRYWITFAARRRKQLSNTSLWP
jgi:hypothetical protein